MYYFFLSMKYLLFFNLLKNMIKKNTFLKKKKICVSQRTNNLCQFLNVYLSWKSFDICKLKYIFSFLGTVLLIFLLPWNIQRSSILSLFFGMPRGIHPHVLKPLASNLQQLWNCWWYNCLTLILLLIQHSLNNGKINRNINIFHTIVWCQLSKYRCCKSFSTSKP